MDTSAVPQPPREHHGEHARGAATRREEQLRTTLHCDDKEKLRRKLALLQREYLKTAERLQRAERLDAVRRHVRSRIGRQDRDQSDPEETAGPRLQPSPWMPSATNGAAPCPGHGDIDSFPKAPAGVSDASRRSLAIRFLLPSDAVGPQTPDPQHAAAAGEAHRPSPALRLRSRRSRLRWERRSAEAGGGSTDDNGEEPREQSGGTEAAGAEGREGGVRAEAANGGEEPLSCDDSESPSLLLAQWDDAPGPAGMGGSEWEEKRQGLKEKDGELPCWTAAPAEATERDATGKGTEGEMEDGEESRDESDGRLFEDSREKDTEQMAPELREEEKSPADTRGVMGSCTLVEGLLYPAEYYVRTTRRMALSQSQPDMQAVIFSQLSAGRHRVRRGPKRSDRRAATGSSSPATSGGDACGELNSHSPGETSDRIPGCEISPDARVPARGRRKRRGGGRAQTPRRPLSSDQQPGPGTTSGDPRTADSPGDAAPLRDEPEAQPGSASGHTEKVFPIFLRTNGSRQTSQRSAACWRSLLLPPSPPAPTALLPRPSHFPAPFFNHLLNFDFPQDFHLPDEQFASLKLLKLRRVAADPAVERLASASYNTRRCKRRPDARGDPPAALALSGSPRPTTSSPAEREHVEETEETPRGDTQEIPVEERLGNEPVWECGERRVGTPPRNRAAGDPGEGHSGSSVAPSEGGAGGRVCDRPQRPAEESPDSSSSAAAARSCDHGDAPGPKEPSDPASIPLGAAGRRVPSQLLLSPPGPSMTPHAPSQPAALCSPTLPSLGLSPHPLRAALPLTSSTPSAPSPTSSPPALLLSPRPAASSPAAVTGAPPETPGRVEPPDSPTPSGGGAEEHVMRRTHTLKAPAGGCLVDACCLRGPSGALCVAAAAAWAVCLWSQGSAADWGLTHTWAFSKPVINVFPVPDAAGLVCVTLGPLEITEVRLLSCSRLSQAPLCEGVVQAVVGVSESRVVTSSHSPSGSTLRVFTASDDGSTSSSQPLASPGVRVGALAPVDGLSDALICSDDGGRLLVWNLKTRQLLRRIALGDGLSHTSCLRGFSSGGALFVLLQHQQLGSPQDAAKEDGNEDDEEEREGAAPFSLVAVNPLSGRSALASRLRPPKGWSGRLCEADVCGGGGVVGLSRSGCVCVWQLGGRGAPRVVGAPGSDGWQLARWGGGGTGGTLVTGHHNGDVTLHGRTG
ncbi:palb2 [Pungitius sinensis]